MSVADKIIAGLKAAIDYVRGKKDEARETVVEVPKPTLADRCRELEERMTPEQRAQTGDVLRNAGWSGPSVDPLAYMNAAMMVLQMGQAPGGGLHQGMRTPRHDAAIGGRSAYDDVFGPFARIW